MSITVEQARKVLSVIDAGLCCGKGVPTPGQMCVEAAVCYGLGLPFGDDPECVEPAIRSFKISLNDRGWSSPAARAKGLRRIGIAQLGSRGTVDGKEFITRLAERVIRVIVPIALEAAAVRNPKHAGALRAAGERCRSPRRPEAPGPHGHRHHRSLPPPAARRGTLRRRAARSPAHRRGRHCHPGGTGPFQGPDGQLKCSVFGHLRSACEKDQIYNWASCDTPE